MQGAQTVGVDLGIGTAAPLPSGAATLGSLAVCCQARAAESLAEEAGRRGSAVLLAQHRVDDLEAGVVGQGARLGVDGGRTVQADGAGLEA